MQSLHETRRPSRVLVLLSFVLAMLPTAACHDTSPAGDAPPTSQPARRTAAPSGSAATATGTAHAIDVGGRLVDDLERPVVARPLQVVDATGKHLAQITDESGTFYALGVVPPYDLLVAPAPFGPVITPLVYLGLTRKDPRFVVFERDGAAPRAASQPVRVTVKLPPCHAVASACWLSMVSASRTGHGGTAASYMESITSASYVFDHVYQQAAPSDGETVDVHVLVGDPTNGTFAYARVLALPSRPGEPVDLGDVTALPVAASEPVSVAGHARDPALGWSWTLASELELPDGAVLPLRYDWQPATSLRVPLLPDATWRVGAWALEPPLAGDSPYAHRSAQARSGTLPIPSADVAIDLPLPPTLVRPTLGSTLSARDDGLAWSEASGLVSAIVVDAARGQQRFRAFTAGAAIPFARLAALGLAPLGPGQHVLDLTTNPGADVDTLTEPDPLRRQERLDLHVPGGSTYERIVFEVAP